jgi:hypothetical protein
MDPKEHIQAEMQHQAELKARREQWEEGRKAQSERAARDEKRARLEAHVKARSEAWRDHTGSEPTTGQVTRWREEYVSQIVDEQQLERDFRLAQAEDIISGS